MSYFADTIRHRVGEEIFVSDWTEVTQPEIDGFAELTRDWDYMHNDPEWAARGPWGGTIAHGFFLLSLLSYFHGQAGFPILATADQYVVNYGLDRVRFVVPVRIGDRLRARMSITAIDQRKPGRDLVHTATTYQTERGGDRPHMVADMLMLCVSGEATRDAR
jgi:acyl dehydratase